MSTLLGSTTKPTWGNEWSAGSSTYNQHAIALTLPSGGPYDIVRLGVWARGYTAATNCRLVVWTAAGAVLGQTATFSMSSAAQDKANSLSWEYNVTTPPSVAGGTTVWVGHYRDPAGGTQFALNSSGTHYDKLNAAGFPAAASMSGATTDSGHSYGAWLYYEPTNDVPDAPTLNSPISGILVSSQTPTLNFTPHDPDGDTHTKYTYQVDNNSDFSSPVESIEVTGSFADGVAVNRVVTSTLSRGTIYYWRVKTNDGTGYGAYSSTASFKIMVQPTTSVTQPASSGAVIESTFTAGGGVAPKPKVRWTFACTDSGHTQNGATIKVYSDAGALLATETVTGTTLYKDIAYAVTRNSLYRFSVTSTCSGGVVGNESPGSGVSARQGRFTYGQGSFKYNIGSTPVSYSTPVVDKSTNGGYCELEYASSIDGAEPAASAWKSSVSSLSVLQWLHHRVTMSGWGSAAPTSPALRSVQLKWNSNVVVPDNWEALGAGETIDVSTQYYGTQCLRLDGNGVTRTVDQTVDVPSGTEALNHLLQVRIRTLAGGGGESAQAEVQIMDVGKTTVLASMTPVNGSTDWTIYTVGPFVPSTSQLVVRCKTTHALGATSYAWFDAIKLEASAIVTPWTPGLLGGGVAIDAGGLQVDASNNSGAIFRLKGSAGGTRDTVELGANGLLIGGDTALYSDTANVLRTPDAFRVEGGLQLGTSTAAPSSNAIALGADAVLQRHAANVVGTAAGDDFIAGAAGGGTTANGVLLRSGGAIEIAANLGTPYIDFKNDLTSDYDGRIRLTSDTALAIEGVTSLTIPNATAGAGILIGGDSNLYRPAANRLRTDDTFDAPNMTTYQNYIASGTLTCATAGTWYRFSGAGWTATSVTPAFTGQRFLVGASGAFKGDNAGINMIVAVRFDTDTTGTLKNWVMVWQEEQINAGENIAFGGMRLWVAPDTGVFYPYFYFQTAGVNTIVTPYSGADYATQISVIPLY